MILKRVTRLSDQGLEIVFRVGLAILQMNHADLIQLDMEGMLQVQRLPFYSSVILCDI